MGKVIEKYLSELSTKAYGIPSQIATVINFAIDSYFKKLDELNSRPCESPLNPKVHVKETWLGCEIHNMITMNEVYPFFAKVQNAWAFAKLLESGTYKVQQFIDTYEWKDEVKDSYEYKIQQESLQVAPDTFATLPIFGSFFIVDEAGNKMIVRIDFGFECNSCVVVVMVAPEKKIVAEKFLLDLNRSVQANDIYFGNCLSYMKGSVGFVDVIPTEWGEIILKEDVIQEIRDNSVGIIKNMDKLASIGMIPSRNIILVSPPGMAKTTVFRAISHEVSGVSRIWCTGKSIDESSDVSALFEAARALAPSIIFIEDMDLFGRDRGSLSSYEGRVLNEFLACLDGIHQNSGVVIMASTNDIGSMDEALINRPGRFDVKIEMPYPDAVDRERMLASFLLRINAHPDASVTRDAVKNVVELTEGLTGAYIKELAKATAIRSVARGNCSDGMVVFGIDDLIAAAEQVIRNFRIGKMARNDASDA